MPHKLHYVLILLRDSATSDLIFGDGIRAKRVASSAYDTSIFSNPNHISWVYNMKSKGPNALPCGTPEITFLYSLTLSRPLDVNYVLDQGQGHGHLSKYLISGLNFLFFSCLYEKKTSKSCLKKGLLIHLSSIKTELAINKKKKKKLL